MAKAKFGLNDILNAKSRAAAAGRVEDYEEIYLSPYEVRAAPENTHQSLENIEELADSFLHVGQEQPTVIARVNGEFRIVDGHRRNAANIMNLERGHKEYEKVKYRYKDMTEAMYELSLLAGNGYTQELTREIQKKLQRAGIETRQVFWSEKERRSYYWKNGAPERCKNPDCKNCPFPPCRKGEANNE